MKDFLIILLCLLLSQVAHPEDTLSVASPDNSIRVSIQMKKRLSYTVYLDDQIILSKSLIDLELGNGNKLSDLLVLKSIKFNKVNHDFESPVPVRSKYGRDYYNELMIQFKKPFTLIFRLYNDGVAYRIATRFKDSVIIRNETALFVFSQGSQIIAPVIQQRDKEDKYHTSFEELYQYKPLDSLDETSLVYTPVLVEEGNIRIVLTESDLDDYPGMFLKGTGRVSLQAEFAGYPLEEKITKADYPEAIVTKRADYIAKIIGTRSLPWRVLAIAREDKQIPANDIVYRLAPPSRLNDISWIHPGKCTDEWIIDVNLFNVPFKSGVNTSSYKYYIDFAKRFGFDRIMMDAGWSDIKDIFKINPDINMDTLVAYANEKGIKLSLWTLALTLKRQLDSALNQFNKWGVDFIMTDFIDRDDQKAVGFYKQVAEACAGHKLMIMFHGAYPPKGFNRTYPNNITREGVLGSEYNAWSDKASPEHDVTLPFTRMLAGPMDYEPGILDNASKSQFKSIWGKVMSQGTRCHQLSMFVVYDSPLQIFSGNPSQGFMEPAFMELLGGIPTTWDTTIILDAKISDYIITVRKKGDEWFIGGMTDWTPRVFDIKLNFLGQGYYDATLCTDGINAVRYPSDYQITTTMLNKDDILHLAMAPGGGFMVKLKKK